MHALIPVIIVVVVGVRLFLHFRGRAGGPRRAGPRLRLPEVNGYMALVAAREVRERVRARAFRVVTILLLVVVAAAVVVPKVTGGKSRPQNVGVVGALTAPQRTALADAARSIGTRYVVVTEPTRTAADAALRAGRIDLAVVDGTVLVVNKPVAPDDTSTTARLVRQVAAELGVQNAFASAGLSAGQIASIAGAHPVSVASLEHPSSPGAALKGTSIIGVIIVFIMLTQYETWTLIGVMEEKSSRVVEVLLAAVRPIQLLGGKVLGIGLVAMSQACAILAFALVLAKAVGSNLLTGTAPTMLAAALLWLLVGYSFYCWVYAAAGSMAERQDQVQTMALPLSLPMIVGYITALTAASAGHASLFVEVLAYLPPTAPFAMPVLVGLGAVSWWGFAASVLISVVCTVGVARMAAVVYRRAVLRTGHRVRLRELISAGA